VIKKFFRYNLRILQSKLVVRLNGKFFLFFMNRMSKKSVTYKKSGEKYYIIEENKVHYFVKSRGGLYSQGLTERTLDLIRSYSIDKIDFQEDDLVIDVGANTGDIFPYFRKQRYIGFEPSPEEYYALKKNTDSKSKIYNYAVGDIENDVDFFVSSAGGDSSIHQPLVIENIIRIKQIRLDKLINERVKLLKVDAEGAEIEVINGAMNLLPNIEFIAIDLGFEKGINLESTAPEVFNLLYENNFTLIAIAKNERFLFHNSKMFSINL